MNDTLALIERAHQGDKTARDNLFVQNTGLIYSAIRRYSGRGVDLEDLFQIGSIGLLKAIDRFDTNYDVQFSTYAIPMIIGEIRRFLRDDGMLKVSRTLKEKQYHVYQKQQEMQEKLGREPTFQELSKEMEMSPEELVLTLESQAEVESLQKTIYQGENAEIMLEEKIPDETNRQDTLLNRIFLEKLLRELMPEERRLIWMRYFMSMTQTEIADKLGVSQVQISRMEKKILNNLRKKSE